MKLVSEKDNVAKVTCIQPCAAKGSGGITHSGEVSLVLAVKRMGVRAKVPAASECVLGGAVNQRPFTPLDKERARDPGSTNERSL